MVLAGGASRRMGTDKPSIVIDGRSLLRRTVDAVRLAGAQHIVIVGREQHDAPSVSGLVSIVDSSPGSGPLGGFLDGLRALGASDPVGVVLLIACDHPDLDADELRVIADRLSVEPPGTAAVVPVVDGRDQTLHAAYRRSLAGPFTEAFATGERSLHRALAGQVVVRVDRTGEGQRSYLDVDDPSQLDAYRQARKAGPANSSG